MFHCMTVGVFLLYILGELQYSALDECFALCRSVSSSQQSFPYVLHCTGYEEGIAACHMWFFVFFFYYFHLE